MFFCSVWIGDAEISFVEFSLATIFFNPSDDVGKGVLGFRVLPTVVECFVCFVVVDHTFRSEVREVSFFFAASLPLVTSVHAVNKQRKN